MEATIDPPSGPGVTTRQRALTVLRWLPPVAWAALIYVASNQAALPQAPSPLLDLLVKKSAHLGEYAVLAALIHHALGPHFAGGESARTGLAWAVAVIYAISDEIHQAHVPGRTAALVDVVIDGLGAALGLGLLHLKQFLAAARPSPPDPAPSRAYKHR